MQTVSQEFKDACEGPRNLATTITVQPPNGDELELQWASAQVTSSNSTGVRHTASLSVIPQPGVDLYSILSTPGAVYRIMHGIDFGPGDPELIPLGVYEASQGSINIIDGDISISLVDRWTWVERSRLVEPLEVTGTDWTNRAELIQAVIEVVFFPTQVAPDGVLVLNTGGTFTDTRVWDRDRTQVVKDLATDGELDVYFNAGGELVIRTQPIIDQGNTVWTFRTGPESNILTAERERPFDRLYNFVVVNPIDEEQTWTRQMTTIEDVDNPRYYEKIGVVPFFYSSPTLTSATEAMSAAETILQRVQGTTETVSLGALGAPMLEVGDTVSIAHQSTPSDPGFSAVHIIDGWDYDLDSGAMTLATRSSTLAETEEA